MDYSGNYTKINHEVCVTLARQEMFQFLLYNIRGHRKEFTQLVMLNSFLLNIEIPNH